VAQVGAKHSKVFIEKEIGGLNSKDRITCSGAVFYSKATKRILLLQKSRGKHQGTWGLVGGTNESKETPWQGLIREIIEEVGQTPVILKTIPLETFVSNDAVFHFHTYLCVVEQEFIPILSDEHCAYAWTTIDYAPRPLHQGLKNSFGSKIIRNKLETIFDIINLL
jgi:8-oxo-dGTP pyrophosphatase MutT (NUDIX family)